MNIITHIYILYLDLFMVSVQILVIILIFVMIEGPGLHSNAQMQQNVSRKIIN